MKVLKLVSDRKDSGFDAQQCGNSVWKLNNKLSSALHKNVTILYASNASILQLAPQSVPEGKNVLSGQVLNI